MSAFGEAQLDVMIEVDKAQVGRLGREGAARYVLEKLRDSADAEAGAVGGHVITDRHPEVIIKEGQSLEYGDDVLLLAARFWVSVPISFDTRSRNHVARVGAFGQAT